MRRLVLLVIGLLILVLPGRAPAEAQPARPAQLRPTGDSTPYTSGLDGVTARQVGEYEPPLPPLIVPSEGAYALRPDWDIEAIEYVYTDWGWASAFASMRVERADGEYRRGDVVVPAENIQVLVRSLSSLHPTPSILSYHTTLDYYPTWKIELTGSNGQRVQLYSRSTANEGAVPWNVVTAGGIYAQFDRSLEDPLFAVLGDETHKPQGRSRSGEPIYYNALGRLTNQSAYGFWGLLPLSENFAYSADHSKGVIEGIIWQDNLNLPQEVYRVEITLPGGRDGSCSILELPDTTIREWSFTCEVATGGWGKPYSYPIAVLVKHRGQPVRYTGVLWGRWGFRHDPSTPLPYEVDLAFSHNQAANDLLSDHNFYGMRYAGYTTAGNPHSGVRNGEIALMGRMPVGDRYADYSVATRFEVTDGGLTHWMLDRNILGDMLSKIAAFPTTRRVLDAGAPVVINTWYASPKQAPEFRLHRGGFTDQYRVPVGSCHGVPGGIYPLNGEPLRAFGYNLSPWSVYQPDFVLVGDRPVAASLTVDTLDGDLARLPLLPEELRTGAARLFERVRLFEGITLELEMPRDATPEERAEYDRIAGRLPGLPRLEGSTWTIGLATLSPQEDGSLKVVGCIDE